MVDNSDGYFASPMQCKVLMDLVKQAEQALWELSVMAEDSEHIAISAKNCEEVIKDLQNFLA